jgi:predicted ATPase/DNA-binding XRE family transcriptional regulator
MVAPSRWSFAQLLRHCRDAAALSQEELAVRAGLSRRGISDLERGLRRAPHPETVRRLAEAMHLADAQRAALLASARRRGRADAGQPTATVALPLAPLPLPWPPSSFVGRESEVAEVLRLLDAGRTLTLIGTGGVGKTRLALEVARVSAARMDSRRAPVAFVDLSRVTDPDVISREIATALRVVEQPGRPVLELLLELLEPHRLLLVLDNCEHVVDAVARLVERLITTCPELRVLATSREPLRVGGEVAWRVPSLGLPEDGSPAHVARSEAVQLFVDRARAAVPHFAITHANSLAVGDVCRRLDGIPLALELAAARMSALGVAEIAQRLDERFQLLTGGSRTAPARHQTLWATLDWSYRLLTADERRLFDRLAVFASSWTLQAAEAICSSDELPPDRVLDLLGQLVDKSLVVVDDTSEGQVRYRLLETIREYSAQRLVDGGRADLVRKRHFIYFLELATRAERHYRSSQEAAWVERLEREHDNLRGALNWALKSREAELGLRLGGALSRFWEVHAHFAEGSSWLDSLLKLHQEALPSARAKALLGAGVLMRLRGDYQRATALAEESLVVWREQGDRDGMAQALNALGTIAADHGEFARATALFESTLELRRELGHPSRIALALHNLGSVAQDAGDSGRAAALLDQSAALFREADDDWGVALAMENRGNVARSVGDVEQAATMYRDGLVLFRKLGDHRGTVACLEGLAAVAAQLGAGERAARFFGIAEALRARIGAPLAPVARVKLEAALEPARAMLGVAAFEAARTAGRTSDPKQAIDDALHALDQYPHARPPSE